LSVVGGEAHGEDFLLVAGELSHGLSGLDVPETEGLVPGRRDTEVSVHGERHVGHEVVVAGELALGHTHDSVLGLFEKVPGHQGFVTGS